MQNHVGNRHTQLVELRSACPLHAALNKMAARNPFGSDDEDANNPFAEDDGEAGNPFANRPSPAANRVPPPPPPSSQPAAIKAAPNPLNPVLTTLPENPLNPKLTTLPARLPLPTGLSKVR